MPIPTKTQSSRTRPEIKSATRLPSTRSVGSVKDRSAATTTSDETSTSLNSAPVDSQTKPDQSRVLPRPTVRTTTAALKHTRSTSSTNATPTMASGSSAASRASSTSSTSTSRVAKDPKQDGSTTASIAKPATTRSRLVPSATITNSTASTRSIPSRIATKAKAPTVPSTSRTIKPPNDPVKTSIASRKPTASSNRDTTTEKPAESNASQLHNEIYQLQLIHAQSHKNLSLYRESIHQTLTTKKTALHHQQDQLLQLEAQDQEALSIQALHEFLYTPNTNTTTAPHTSPNPSEKIQLLSSTITELSNLTTSNPSSLVPLSQFSNWLTHALAVREARTSTSNPPIQPTFIPSLGTTWTTEIHILRQTLQTLVSTLRSFNLPPDAETSGISVVVIQQRRFAETLLREVETAISLEKAITADEVAWEAELLESAMAELEGMRGGEDQGVWVTG